MQGMNESSTRIPKPVLPLTSHLHIRLKNAEISEVSVLTRSIGTWAQGLVGLARESPGDF